MIPVFGLLRQCWRRMYKVLINDGRSERWRPIEQPPRLAVDTELKWGGRKIDLLINRDAPTL